MSADPIRICLTNWFPSRMNLWLRLILVLISRYFRKPLRVTDESNLRFFVCPNDLDIYGHMNNGRYLTLMDLGRIDLILRSPLGKLAAENRWNPLVASSHMTFRRPLTVLEPYHLRTRILGWDEKWFFIEQRFESHHKTIATGYIKGLFRGPEGNVTPEKALKLSGFSGASPNIADVKRLFEDSVHKRK